VTLQRPAAAAPSLDQVTLSRGTRCLVQLAGGEVVRGRVDDLSAAAIVLAVDGEGGDKARRTIAHGEIAVLARLVTMSKARRGCIGAAIVGLASLSFGISIAGDMIVPAAIGGALAGYHTGEERALVVYERRPGGR
jgi:hypothetical protein